MVGDLPDGYPEQWETDALLKDGATVRVRPIRPDDSDRMERFHNRQSQESIYFRFFRFRPQLNEKELIRFTTVDYVERMAFIALIGDEMVAVSRYEGENSTDNSAEVAFFVDDAHHERGLATLMLEYLAQRARAQGITTFTATVLPENYRMLAVFKGAGFDVTSRFEDGAIAVTLGIGNPRAAQGAIDSRDQLSRSRAVERFFEPTSVAVVGAGRTPGSVGHELLRSIVEGGYQGRVVAINPHAKRKILGVETTASITDLEEPVELAIVAIPAESVVAAVEECIAAGVKALVIVSAGFTDEVAEGRAAPRCPGSAGARWWGQARRPVELRRSQHRPRRGTAGPHPAGRDSRRRYRTALTVRSVGSSHSVPVRRAGVGSQHVHVGRPSS